jgi:hypothetical protein
VACPGIAAASGDGRSKARTRLTWGRKRPDKWGQEERVRQARGYAAKQCGGSGLAGPAH